MSIAVYSLVPNSGVPNLQQVCAQGAETDIPITITDTPSGQQWILSGTDLTTDVGTDKIKIALFTGIELLKLDGFGAETYSNRLFPQVNVMIDDVNYTGTVKNFTYANAVYFAYNTTDRFILNAGGNAADRPLIFMNKVQGGGTTTLQQDPTASSNDALSYLPFDTTNNTSGYQLKATLPGTFTMVAGVATVTNSNVKSISQLQINLKTPGGVMGARVKVVLSGATFTITSVDLTGATVITDTSIYDYLIEF